MPKVTSIKHWEKGDRYYVKLDGQDFVFEDGKKFSIRARIFPAMNLSEGMEITWEELINFEKYVFKRLYGPSSWEKEKVRISAVKQLIESVNPNVQINITGFGAGTTDTLLFHPEESGKPDLSLIDKRNGRELMLVEVSGTERMRDGGIGEYWIRPDKLEYIEKHSSENIWIILHYQEPVERYIYIKPIKGKKYSYEVEVIKSVEERYVKFRDASEEVRTFEEFQEEVLRLLDLGKF